MLFVRVDVLKDRQSYFRTVLRFLYSRITIKLIAVTYVILAKVQKKAVFEPFWVELVVTSDIPATYFLLLK